MKLLYDFFPIILFFVAYKLQGIYVATAVAIAASFTQVGYYYWRHRRFERMHLVSLGLIAVLGGLTLALQEKAFIMWKPTLINWLFALVFLASPLVGGKPLVRRMLDGKVVLPDPVWKRLNHLWVGFFFLAGCANLYFAHSYQLAEAQLLSEVPSLSAEAVESLDCSLPEFGSVPDLCATAHDREELWVNFKLFGLLGLTVLFVIGQALYLARHIEEEPETSTTGSGGTGDKT